jgi:type III pantothenate kinase
MILLFDIGNTHTHLGLADGRRVLKQTNIPTREWSGRAAGAGVVKFVGAKKITGAAMCSVVPCVTPLVRKFMAQLGTPASGPARKVGVQASACYGDTLKRELQRAVPKTGVPLLELNPKTICGVGIDYPKPDSIGPDRLANAVAARQRFGAPVVVVDFGTAVTFDVVDARGNYVGGIIAPGLAAMTDYLHEKTALLPKIKIREPRSAVGKSTEEAMLVGAVQGYRGLVRGLIGELKRELRAKRLPVVATGGYAKLIAAGLPEISAVAPDLTLEGLRLVWQNQHQPIRSGKKPSIKRLDRQ